MTEGPSGLGAEPGPRFQQLPDTHRDALHSALAPQQPPHNVGVEGDAAFRASAVPVLFTHAAYASGPGTPLSSPRGSSSSMSSTGAVVMTNDMLDSAGSSSHYRSNRGTTKGPQFAAQYNYASAQHNSNTAAIAADGTSPDQNGNNKPDTLLLQQRCGRCRRAECLCTELAPATGCMENAVTPRQISASASMSSLGIATCPSSNRLVVVPDATANTTMPSATLILATASAGNSAHRPISYNHSSNSLYRKKGKYNRNSPGCSNQSMKSMPGNRQHYKQQQQRQYNSRNRHGTNEGASKQHSRHKHHEDRPARRGTRRHGEHNAHCRAVLKLSLLALMMITTSGIFYGNNAAKELWRNAESLQDPVPPSLSFESPHVLSSRSAGNTYAQHRVMQLAELSLYDGAAANTSAVMESNALSNNTAESSDDELARQRMLSVVVQSEQNHTDELAPDREQINIVSDMEGAGAAKDIRISSASVASDEYSGHSVDASKNVVGDEELPSATIQGNSPLPDEVHVEEPKPSDDQGVVGEADSRPAAAADASRHPEAMQAAVNLKQLQPNYSAELPKIEPKQQPKPASTVDEVDLAQAVKLYQTADFFGLAICGWILDRFGPRMTEMGAQVICAMGFFLYGFGWLKLPAVLQGLTSTAILSSVASVSNLFVGKEAIATGVLVGASDASTLLLPTFVVLTQKFPKITYEGLMTAMGYLSASYVGIACMILPDEPYHRHRHHHHDDHENPPEARAEKEDEKQALLNRDDCSDSIPNDSMGAYHSTDADMLRCVNGKDGQDTADAKVNLVSTNGDFRSRFASVQSAPDNVWRRSSDAGSVRSHSNGNRNIERLTELSLNGQVTHPLFVCFVGVWTLHALRVCLYMDLNEIFFSYLGDKQVLTRAYSWMLPVGALFSVISGVVCQRSGVRKALLYETIVSVLISAVCCIPVLAAQWVSIVGFLVLSGSIWTIAVGYMAELFGYAHFGMMMGILSVTVGIVNQTIGGAALHLVLSNGPVCCYYVNAVQLVLGILSIAGNVLIIRHGCEVEKEVSQKVHFGVDDDCPRVSYFYSGKIQSMMPAICFSDTDSENSSC